MSDNLAEEQTQDRIDELSILLEENDTDIIEENIITEVIFLILYIMILKNMCNTIEFQISKRAHL